MPLDRRTFMKSALAVSTGFAGLRALGSSAPAYGAQVQKKASGELLAISGSVFDLPPGFKATVISRAGTEMSDGFLVPGAADGMATFNGPNGLTVIVRNHELAPHQHDLGPFGPALERLSKLERGMIYDWAGGKPCPGGTTNIIYDTRKGVVVEERLSLVGTNRNCAGGPTPWNSWITCEEDVMRIGDRARDGWGTMEKNHGYNFEVPCWLGARLAAPVPLVAMGRFNHEAIAVEPARGIVYQTEDRHDGLIYRFLPRQPGNLHAGGKLQALVVKEQKGLDTRNWEQPTVKPGVRLDVEWIDMANVEAPDDDLRLRGFAAGAARFARGEGMWHGNDEVYFACTNGGAAKKGQIWRYIPSEFEGTGRESEAPGKLELFVEAANGNVIDNADNLTVAPWGDVIICEDGAGPDQFIRGITPAGHVYNIARNAISESELAGVCFSPDGSTLFVNIQFDHLTVAITGPWETLKA